MSGLEFSHSLKSNREFRRLYAKGKRTVTPFLVVYCRKTKYPQNSLGITVSTKLGKAVRRNRVRRRLREIYRLNEHRFLRGVNIVVAARVRSTTASYRELEVSFLSACGKLGLLQSETQP